MTRSSFTKWPAPGERFAPDALDEHIGGPLPEWVTGAPPGAERIVSAELGGRGELVITVDFPDLG
jgi:hypothetical protein